MLCSTWYLGAISLLDVEGRFSSKTATPRGPVSEYSLLKSENDKRESAGFLARIFWMIELSESS